MKIVIDIPSNLLREYFLNFVLILGWIITICLTTWMFHIHNGFLSVLNGIGCLFLWTFIRIKINDWIDDWDDNV